MLKHGDEGISIPFKLFSVCSSLSTLTIEFPKAGVNPARIFRRSRTKMRIASDTGLFTADMGLSLPDTMHAV